VSAWTFAALATLISTLLSLTDTRVTSHEAKPGVEQAIHQAMAAPFEFWSNL
jgi:hypothetical protein